MAVIFSTAAANHIRSSSRFAYSLVVAIVNRSRDAGSNLGLAGGGTIPSDADGPENRAAALTADDTERSFPTNRGNDGCGRSKAAIVCPYTRMSLVA
jgi:hypothetical protein